MTASKFDISIQGNTVTFNLNGHARILPNSSATYKSLLHIFEETLAFYASGRLFTSLSLSSSKGYLIKLAHHSDGLYFSHSAEGARQQDHAVRIELETFSLAIAKAIRSTNHSRDRAVRLNTLITWASTLTKGTRPGPTDNQAVSPRHSWSDGQIVNTSRPHTEADDSSNGAHADIFRMAYRRVWTHATTATPSIHVIHNFVAAPHMGGLHLIHLESGHIIRDWPGAVLLPGKNCRCVSTDQAQIVRVQLDGDIAWATTPFSCDNVYALYETADIIIATSTSGSAIRLDAESGHRIWHTKTFFGHITAVEFTTHSLWLLGEDGLVHQLDIETGAVKMHHRYWPHALVRQLSLTSHLILAERDLRNAQFHLRCLSDNPDLDRWCQRYPGRLLDIDRHCSGRIIFLYKMRNHLILSSIAPLDGRIVCQTEISLPDHEYRLFVLDEIIIVKAINGGGVAYDPSTFQCLWSLSADDEEQTLTKVTSPIASGGRLFWPGYTLRVISISTGETIQTIYRDDLYPEAMMMTERQTLIVYDGLTIDAYTLGGVLTLLRKDACST